MNKYRDACTNDTRPQVRSSQRMGDGRLRDVRNIPEKTAHTIHAIPPPRGHTPVAAYCIAGICAQLQSMGSSLTQPLLRHSCGGSAPTREVAMAAFAKSWRREPTVMTNNDDMHFPALVWAVIFTILLVAAVAIFTLVLTR